MGKWASWGLTERATSVLIDGTALAIVGAGLLVLGYLVSTKFRTNFWQFMTVKPKAFYASSIAITALCSVGAVAFA